MTEINPESLVGQLVADKPVRARVFEGYRIDYCCRGNRSLARACEDRGIDLEAVLSALREVDSQQPGEDEEDWSARDLGVLIEHIVSHHHEFLRRELPRLEQLFQRVVSVHGDKDERLGRAQETFVAMRAELEQHMFKEEQILFPAVVRIERAEVDESLPFASVQGPIGVMEHEHDSAGTALAAMRHLTDDFTPPESACNSWRALLDGLSRLEVDLHRHIHEENNILFPRALELERAGRFAGAARC